MKSNQNKIILYLMLIFFLSSCHTLEHKNIFLETVEKNQKKTIISKENNYKQIKSKKIDLKKTINEEEKVNIKVPKQKKKVKTVALRKKIHVPKVTLINLNQIKNWSEKKLIQEIGQGDFIKKEGKMKNYQYYFTHCFLDIFLTKKDINYFVSFIQTRSTKLYGKLENKKCLKEISKKLDKNL